VRSGSNCGQNAQTQGILWLSNRTDIPDAHHAKVADARSKCMSDKVSSQELQKQIARIQASPLFARARQLAIFLELLTSRVCAENGEVLTQTEIAKALGLRDFDPTKPTVRIAAERLRARLMEYYVQQGRTDPVLVEFPKGHPYRVVIRHRGIYVQPRADEAFKLCCDGRMLWAQRTPESLYKAISCFERAIQIDPTYAEPHAALAECYLFLAIDGAPANKLMRKAKLHAKSAIQIDPHFAEGHAALGAVHSAFEWEWSKADKEFDTALELDANSLAVFCLRATHLVSRGRLEDAANDARRLLQLTSAGPSPLVTSHAAKILYVTGNWDEAEELLLRLQATNPDFYMVHWQLGLLHGAKGRLAAGREAMTSALRLRPDSTSMMAGLGWINALAGEMADAARILATLESRRKKSYVSGTDLAMIHAVSGNLDRSFACLENAFHERSVFLPWLGVWPPLRSLFLDARSGAILKRMHLEHATFPDHQESAKAQACVFGEMQDPK
jgi:tetratricopeptide (TPR) repeat protein